jgi:hypothetical protein
VSEGRPEKPNVWFWLAVAGALLAVPVAVLTTCQVRGEYVPTPAEHKVAPAEFHGLESICLGVGVGVPLTVTLIWTAVRLRRRKPLGVSRQQPQPGSEFSPLTEWQACWRQPSKGSDPSVRPADDPIREPPEAS